MPNYRTTPSTPPQPRDEAVVYIRGLALSLGAERTEHTDEFDHRRQAFRLQVGPRSAVVKVDNLEVDHVLSDSSVSDKVTSQLKAALASLEKEGLK